MEGGYRGRGQSETRLVADVMVAKGAHVKLYVPDLTDFTCTCLVFSTTALSPTATNGQACSAISTRNVLQAMCIL